MDATQIQLSQSLPIKAVFRDSVVGIRYLHPRIVPPGAIPVNRPLLYYFILELTFFKSYRRFQMTFISAAAAAQFVDAICPVCPCKPNQPAAPSHTARQSTTANVSTNFQTRPFSLARPAVPPFSSSTLNPSKTSVPTKNSAYTQNPVPSCSSLKFSSDPIDPATRNSSETAQSSSNQSSSHDTSAPSSFSSGMMPPPPPATHPLSLEAEPNESHKAEFMESLKKTCSLNTLSRSQLEDLVAQVVREDGFAKLVCIHNSVVHLSDLMLLKLESLDSMWKVKGYLGR